MKRLHRSLFLLLLVLLLLPVAALAKDARTQEDRYEDALKLVEDNCYSEAAAAFDKLKDFEDSVNYAAYARALQAYAMADYDTALAGFTALGDFEYSAEYAAIIPQMDRVFVRRVDHYAMVDTKGNLICDTPWDYAGSMNYGGQRPGRVLYAVFLGDVSMDENGKIVMSEEGHWGLVDGDGQIVLAPEWDGIFSIGDTSALMEKDGKRYVVSLADGQIVSEGFDSSNGAYVYHANDRYSVKLDDKAYIVDAEGNSLALPEDVNIVGQTFLHREVLRRQEEAYRQQLIPFSGSENIGFLNQDGEIVIPAKYSDAAYMGKDGLYNVGIDGAEGYVRADGSVAVALQYKSIEVLYGRNGATGAYIVETEEGYQLIDEDGNPVGKTYDKIETNSYNTVLTFEQNGKVGLMDRSGKVLAKAAYDKIYSFRSNGLAIFSKGEKLGLINAAGKVVLKEDDNGFSTTAAGRYYVRAIGGGMLAYVLVTADGKLQKDTLMTAAFDGGGDSMIWSNSDDAGMTRVTWGKNSKSQELDSACYLTFNGTQCSFAVTADTRMPQNLSQWGGKDSITDVARPDNYDALYKFDMPRMGLCMRPFVEGEDMSDEKYAPETDMDGVGLYLGLGDESDTLYMPELRNKGTVSIHAYEHDDDSETLADIRNNSDIIPSFMTSGITSSRELSRPLMTVTEHYYRMPGGEMLYTIKQSITSSVLSLLGGYAGSSISSTYYVLYNTHNGLCYLLSMYNNDSMEDLSTEDFLPLLATIETYTPSVRHPATTLEEKQTLTFPELGFSIQAPAGTRMTWYGEGVTLEQAAIGNVLEYESRHETSSSIRIGTFIVSVYTDRSAEEVVQPDGKTYKVGKLTFYTSSPSGYFLDVPNTNITLAFYCTEMDGKTAKEDLALLKTVKLLP